MALKGLAERVALLKAAAEERGPIVVEEEFRRFDDDGEFSEPKRPTLVMLPPLGADEVTFAPTAELRAQIADRCAGLDCETFLIQPGRNTPRLVVTGYQSPDGRQAIVTGRADDPTVHARAFLAFTEAVIRDALRTVAGAMNTADGTSTGTPTGTPTGAPTGAPMVVAMAVGTLLINQNIAFDFCVIAEDAHQADVILGLVGQPESWFDAVMERIFEMLDLLIVEDTMLRERLIDLAEGTLGKDWTSLTESGNPRRKSYALKPLALAYLNVDLDKFTYRTGYSKYLNKDISEYEPGAVQYLTDDVESALHVAARQTLRAQGHGLPVGARIPNSAQQSKAAFSLQLVSSWGMRTDLSKVQQFDADLDRTKRSMLRVLQESGIVRTQGRDAGTKDMKRIHDLVRAAYEREGLVVPMTDGGKSGKPQVSTAGAVLEDIALIELRGNTKEILNDDGEIDESELMRQPLYCLSQYVSVDRLQKTLEMLYTGTQHPINTRFETILETGRISSYKPNMNNLPRGGPKTLLQRLQMRVRQCFVPRPGFMFCSVDYSMLELCTLAQCLIWFFSESKMADAINAGYDLHTLFAAEQLLHITYEEAIARKKEDLVKDMRQLGKVCNFGLGGGMGGKALKDFAADTYNVLVTIEEAKDLKAKWLMQWPEMRKYFRLVSSMMRGFDDRGVPVGDVEQFVSGRIRGRARYCALANSFFQGLAADGAKTALYALQKECYLRRGSLYGSRVVAFFYDEFFMEHPIETAAERAQIQSDIAVKEMQQICTDVKIAAEPALQECWLKAAETVFNKDGRLIPWKPQKEQTEDFYDRNGKMVSPMKRAA